MLTIIATLVMVQITIACVTLYLHRSQAHKSVEFHPVVAHAMRFWLWLTTGMITRQWVAIHRKHHRFTDEPGDPHSPHVFGIWNILCRGVMYYVREGSDVKTIMSYGKGTPTDWIERNLYARYNFLGVAIMLIIDLIAFGYVGAVVWLVQILWIPFWAAGVVNGLGHWWGYRNGETREHSTNVVPVDFLVGGELLHNNHHLDPGSAKLSRKWWEFDLGWMYIKILEKLKLAQIRQ